MSGTKQLMTSTALAIALLAGPTHGRANADDMRTLSDYQAFAEFLPNCPGDRTVARPDDGNEILGALGGLVTSLLGTVISKGFGRLGKKLKESSEEQITENIHTGDTFHTLQVADEKPVFSLQHNCLVIVTAPTTRTANSTFITNDRTSWPNYYARSVYEGTRKAVECVMEGDEVVGLNDLRSDASYNGQSCTFTDPINNSTTSYARTFAADDGLTEYLTEANYEASGDYSQPSSILVMDIEYSLGNTYFRFVPRYFAVPIARAKKRSITGDETFRSNSN